MHKGNITHQQSRIHNGRMHYLNRRDLERRLDFHERLNLHLIRINRYLTARLVEVRHDVPR